jgi:hypothetical protein
MKIDREKYPFLGKEEFEAFIDQLKSLEVDTLMKVIEDKVPETSLQRLYYEAKEALEEVTGSVKDIEDEMTRIRKTIEKWNPNQK